jgi:hypothetical protein
VYVSSWGEKMKILGTAALAAICVLSSTATSWANEDVASIADMKGKVLVNAGSGFVPAEAGMALSAGDKILVGKDSFASIAYPECTIAVEKPGVTSVVSAPVCDLGANAAVITPAGHSYLPPPQALAIVGGVVVSTTVIAIAGGLGDDNCPVSGTC